MANVKAELSESMNSLQKEGNKLQRQLNKLSEERDDVITRHGKYRTFGRREIDSKLEEIKSQVKEIQGRQNELIQKAKTI